MQPVDFKELLIIYQHSWAEGMLKHASFDQAEEAAKVADIIEFFNSHKDVFKREHLKGHFTGSALVVDPQLEKVLLTHHKKLGMWLQLGGHADGEVDLSSVAWRETEEESGLTNLEFLDYEGLILENVPPDLHLPFDIDRHVIPSRPDEPEHIHYDIRYIIIAHPEDMVMVSEESHDVKWFTIAEARKVTSERSMHRQFDKLAYLRENLL